MLEMDLECIPVNFPQGFSRHRLKPVRSDVHPCSSLTRPVCWCPARPAVPPERALFSSLTQSITLPLSSLPNHTNTADGPRQVEPFRFPCAFTQHLRNLSTWEWIVQKHRILIINVQTLAILLRVERHKKKTPTENMLFFFFRRLYMLRLGCSLKDFSMEEFFRIKWKSFPWN